MGTPSLTLESTETAPGVFHAAPGRAHSSYDGASGAEKAGSGGVGGAFSCIVADPPWDVKRLESPGSEGFGTQNGVLKSKPLPYQTMSVWEVAAMKVPAAKNAHLYMWTINSYVEAAYMVARAWGFEPSCLLSWIKSPMGLGHGGTFCNTTEFILFARRGNLKAKKRVDRTWFGWPRGEHSQKPEDFQTIVESVSPGPYLELFARRKREGWMHFGNQIESDVRIDPVLLGGGGSGVLVGDDNGESESRANGHNNQIQMKGDDLA